MEWGFSLKLSVIWLQSSSSLNLNWDSFLVLEWSRGAELSLETAPPTSLVEKSARCDHTGRKCRGGRVVHSISMVTIWGLTGNFISASHTRSFQTTPCDDGAVWSPPLRKIKVKAVKVGLEKRFCLDDESQAELLIRWSCDRGKSHKASPGVVLQDEQWRFQVWHHDRGSAF